MSDDNLVVRDGGVVTKFEIPSPKLYVAVYYYPGSETPWGATGADKNMLITQMNAWIGIDRERGIRIYTINL